MLRALSTAATGMEAQEMRIDLLANNLANVNTTGFKKSRGEFQDLLYETLRSPGASSGNGTQVPTGLQVGQGVRAVATLRQFSVGDLKQTGNPLDLAIEGNGFFQIRKTDGQTVYSRDGAFKTDAQGRIVTSDGLLLEPALVVPPDAQGIQISSDGTVSVLSGNGVDRIEIGHIELASFANPAGLTPLGRNLYSATPASGEAVIQRPGSEFVGTLAQGTLEMSNVKVVEEMVDLITTQRAYETNSRVIQAADEMLRSTAAIR